MRRESIKLFGPFLLAGSIYAGCAANAAAAQAQDVVPPPAPTLDISDCRTIPTRTLTVGTCVRSTLDANDPLFQERARYEDYELALRRGEAVQIDMDALPAPADPAQGPARRYSFDTFLEVRLAAEGPPLVVNDDRSDSLNSRLIFVADDDRAYIVRARAFGAGTGDYVLRTSAVSAPPRPMELEGGRIVGSLELGSQTVAGPAGDSQRQVSYYFEGRARERVRLTSGSANISLQFLQPNGVILGRDYGPEEGRVELLTVLPQDGRYIVQVRAPVSHQPTVPFDIRVERGVAPAPEQPQRIEVGVPVPGEFTVSSAAKDRELGSAGVDYFYRLYEVRTNARRPLRITVDAEGGSFDPVVDVGSITPLGFAAAQSDDDGGEGWNARLILPAPHPATLIIRVRTFGEELGRYSLLVAEEPPAAAPAPR